MIKVMIVALISLMSFAPIMAQNIKGKIENTKGEPLAFVNVVLLTRGDSAFVKGAVSGEDGSFVIDSPCNDGIIKVSSIGYTTVFRDCRGEDMGVIRLSEDSWMLGEIVVRSQLPKTVLSGEGMTTTVSGSVLEKTANMEQLLSRIPSVSAKDGDIEVFGRGTPVIYINGRKMQDQMELQRLQPTDIKNIEVISNPGARYDASVKSVIRITTKKPQGEGFSFDNSTSFVINEDKRMSYKNIRKGYFNTDLSLYKALFKNRLTLTLDVSDLFATGNQYRTFYSGAARTLFYDAYSVSSITLGIRYRFNATNSKYKGTGAGQSQKNRM